MRWPKRILIPGMLAVLAVPALVMMLAAGSLSGQPIYAGGPFPAVTFPFPPNNQNYTPATIQLLSVEPFTPSQIPLPSSNAIRDWRSPVGSCGSTR